MKRVILVGWFFFSLYGFEGELKTIRYDDFKTQADCDIVRLEVISARDQAGQLHFETSCVAE